MTPVHVCCHLADKADIFRDVAVLSGLGKSFWFADRFGQSLISEDMDRGAVFNFEARTQVTVLCFIVLHSKINLGPCTTETVGVSPDNNLFKMLSCTLYFTYQLSIYMSVSLQISL